MAELYPNLPFLPDTPDRPRYRPLAATVDHLRKRYEFPLKLADEPDIAVENHRQEMTGFNKNWIKTQRIKKK